MKYSPYQRRLFEQAFRNLVAGLDGNVEPEREIPSPPVHESNALPPAATSEAAATVLVKMEPLLEAPQEVAADSRGGGEFSLGALAEGMRSLWGKRQRHAEAEGYDGSAEMVPVTGAESHDVSIEAKPATPANQPEVSQALSASYAELSPTSVGDTTENPVFDQQAKHYFATLPWQSGAEVQPESYEQAIRTRPAETDPVVAPACTFPNALATIYFKNLPWQEVTTATPVRPFTGEAKPVAKAEAQAPAQAIALRPATPAASYFAQVPWQNDEKPAIDDAAEAPHTRHAAQGGMTALAGTYFADLSWTSDLSQRKASPTTRLPQAEATEVPSLEVPVLSDTDRELGPTTKLGGPWQTASGVFFGGLCWQQTPASAPATTVETTTAPQRPAELAQRFFGDLSWVQPVTQDVSSNPRPASPAGSYFTQLAWMNGRPQQDDGSRGEELNFGRLATQAALDLARLQASHQSTEQLRKNA